MMPMERKDLSVGLVRTWLRGSRQVILFPEDPQLTAFIQGETPMKARVATESAKKPNNRIREAEAVLLTGSPDPKPNNEVREEEIRELAFQLYVDRGRIEGRDLENWLEAEAFLREKGKLAA